MRHSKSQVKPKENSVSLITHDSTFHSIIEFDSQTLGYTGFI